MIYFGILHFSHPSFTTTVQVRKSDHAGFLRDLSALVRSGKVRAESYQPRGRGPYHFKITKLQPKLVTLESLGSSSCSCASRSYGTHKQTTPSNCLLKECKEKLAKQRDDKFKYNAVKAFLTQGERDRLEGRTHSAGSSASARAATANPYAARTLTSISVTKPNQGATLGIGMPVGVCPIQITSISPTSLFAGTSLRVGMIIRSINGRGYTTFDEGLVMMKEARGTLTVVARVPPTAPTNPYAARPAVNPYARGSGASGNGAHGRNSSTGQPAAKKQKTTEVIELLDDDDDIQFEGVVTMEDAIARKRKEAEEKGEVVEIN